MRYWATAILCFWLNSITLGQSFNLSDTTVSVDDVLITYYINIELGGWKLMESSFPFLDSVVYFLNANPNVKVEVGYHLDDRYKPTYSMDISQKRAQEVVDYLIKHGISSSRLVAKGYNESSPIVWERNIERMNSPEAREKARVLNRRTELKIIKIE